MNRFLLFLILLSLQSKAQKSGLHNYTNEIASFEKNGHARLYNNREANANANNYNIVYTRCEWEVDPALNYIKGIITVFFIMQERGQSISFDLVNELITDSVVQRKQPLNFSHTSNELAITLNHIVNIGQLDSVSIYYQGTPASSGFGSFILSTHDSVPVLWTLSEPYGSRDWWPCKNGLEDKIDSIDIFINHPSNYKAASNGLLQSELIINNGTRIITHWKHRYPIASYLVCMAVTNYVTFENNITLDGVELPMTTFCYPENQADFETGTQYTLNALRLFHQYLGPYPFIKEKYGHVQFGWGGGMEHQTSTFISNTDERLTSHELAHQWFGDNLTCASWKEIWLNEGFATFLARFYFEQKYPSEVVNERRAVVEDITSFPDGSVYVSDTSDVNRVFDSRLTYNKGSFLLEMLRLKLGDSLFFKGLKEYQQSTSLMYNFTTTRDLKNVLENVSATDLNNFFTQWYTGEGYPSYYIQWSMLGDDHIKVKINQTTSHASVSFFEMKVPLTFKNNNQEETIYFDNHSNGEVFIKELNFTPDTIIVDQGYQLISKNNSSKKIGFPIEDHADFDVYPNPIKSNTVVYLHDFMENEANLSVYNMNGQLLFTKVLSLFNGTEMVYLHMENFSKGAYIINIVSGNKQYTKKIIK